MIGIYQEKYDLFQNLTYQEFDELVKNSTKTIFGKNDTLAKQNAPISHVMLLVEGLVKMTIETHAGKSMIIKLCKGGTILGLGMHFTSETYNCSFIALSSVTVKFIDISVFKNIIDTNPQFTNRILLEVAQENKFLTTRIGALAHKQLPGKFADILLYLSKYVYSSNKFLMPLSRQDLADLAGTTKESLIRTLSEFKNDKIIDVQGKNISINSISIVETLSKLG